MHGYGLEPWIEAVRTLARQRTRSLVTALSMSWGLFMLVVLLGAASGLEHGAEYTFRDDATNSLWIYPGETTVPYRGTPIGRPVQFDNGDVDALVGAIPEVEHITGRFRLKDEFTVTRDERRAFFEVRAVHPDHLVLERTIITAGRFINAIDLDDRRKVAVLGAEPKERLFGASSAIGEQIAIDGVYYLVVGEFADEGGEGEERLIYIPISTAQLVYGGAQRVNQIMFTIPSATTVEDSRRVADHARRVLAGRHALAIEDPGAIRIDNGIESAARIQGVLEGIAVFTWVVGLGTIVAGVVGVGNILLISVAERRREIGIRRAIGASAGSIVAMVLREALILTVVSGYGGLLLGIAVITWLAPLLPPNDVFRDPTAEPVALAIANVVLVVAGLVAGAIPAYRATRLTPVEALRG